MILQKQKENLIFKYKNVTLNKFIVKEKQIK